MSTTVNTEGLLTSTNRAEYVAAGGELQSSENQRILDRLVQREVMHCISSTVAYVLAVAAETPNDAEDYDEKLTLCSADDWETPGRDHIASMDRQDLLDYLDDEEAEQEDDDAVRAMVIDKASDDWQEFGSDQRLDPEQFEAYEHWAVTKWFKEKLAGCGEITGELLDFDVWGRCCTGQSISMDDVIATIAASMQILDGQKHSWK